MAQSSYRVRYVIYAMQGSPATVLSDNNGISDASIAKIPVTGTFVLRTSTSTPMWSRLYDLSCSHSVRGSAAHARFEAKRDETYRKLVSRPCLATVGYSSGNTLYNSYDNYRGIVSG